MLKVPLPQPTNLELLFWLCMCLFLFTLYRLAAGFAEDGGSNTEIPAAERPDICDSEPVPELRTWSCATCVWSSCRILFAVCCRSWRESWVARYSNYANFMCK